MTVERKKIGSFDNLKNGDLIISPIDNEVTKFVVNKEGEKFLMGTTSLFPIFQFDADDFYYYDGNFQSGEKDNDFFK